MFVIVHLPNTNVSIAIINMIIFRSGLYITVIICVCENKIDFTTYFNTIRCIFICFRCGSKNIFLTVDLNILCAVIVFHGIFHAVYIDFAVYSIKGLAFYFYFVIILNSIVFLVIFVFYTVYIKFAGRFAVYLVEICIDIIKYNIFLYISSLYGYFHISVTIVSFYIVNFTADCDCIS